MQKVCLRRKRKSLATLVCVLSAAITACLLMVTVQGPPRGDVALPSDYDLASYDLEGDTGRGLGIQTFVRHLGIVKAAVGKPEAASDGGDAKARLPIPVFNYKREDVFPHEGGMRRTEGFALSLQVSKSNDSDDYNIKNLVVEDSTDDDDADGDNDDDDDDEYSYDDNYVENPRFKMEDFDMRNFTAFQAEEDDGAAYHRKSAPAQEYPYGYDDEGDPHHVPNKPVAGLPDSAGNNVVDKHASQPCGPSGSNCNPPGVHLPPGPTSLGEREGHRDQFVDAMHQQEKQPNDTREGQRKIVKGQVRTLKRADVAAASILYQSRIETQIPLQDGMDANVLGVHQPATQIQTPQLPWQPGEVRSKQGMPLVVNRIYWSKEVEDLIPKGVTDLDKQHFLHKISTSHVGRMQEPQWNKCGRPKNQHITLDDGTQLCARYRDPHNKLIQGEILTFHLAHLLGLDNIPMVALTQVNSSAPQWHGRADNIAKAGWQQGKLAALIQWVDGLESERSRVRMPTVILEAYQMGRPITWTHPQLTNLTADQLAQALQWGDMILLDYITGHYDRVASMQDGADRENKPSIMGESIRNLRQWPTGKLWLIDNESGLLDSYDLMYRGGDTGSRFITFHLQMLKTMCIFHRSFVEKVQELAKLANPAEALVAYTTVQEPLYKKLPPTSKHNLFTKLFHTRLKDVVRWVENCHKR